MSDQPTRNRIVAVTRELLARPTNTDGVSVGQVAKAAHVSRATIYRYFPDKGTLLRAAGHEAGAPGERATPRERILAAMLEVVGERGLHAATLDEIAGRAGLSRSGLTWHYKNKDELIADLARYIPILSVVEDAVAQAASPGADLEAQLTLLVTVLLEQLGQYRGVIRFLLAEAAVYPDVARLTSTHTIGRALPLLARLFEQHERNGTLRPGSAQVRAQAFMGMFMSLFLLRPAFAALLAPDDGETAREYIDIFLRGTLAAPQEE